MSAITVRCSSLPMLRKCSAPMRLLAGVAGPIVELDPYNPASGIGTCVHALLASWLRTGIYPDVEAACSEHGVDPNDAGEVGWLFNEGVRIWNDDLKRHFHAELQVEQRETITHETPGGTTITITGQPDVFSCFDGVGFGVDWKTGRIESDYIDQAKGYALVKALKYGLKSVGFWVVFLRTGRGRYFLWTLKDLLAWFNSVVVNDMVARAGTFSPGDHCEHCPALLNCGPRTKYIQLSVSEIAAQGDDGSLLAALNDPAKRAEIGPVLAKLWDRRGIVKSTIDRFEAAVKESIKAHGPIPLGNGKQIGLEPYERTEIKPEQALPVLHRAIGEVPTLRAMSLSKGAVEEEIKSRAAKGMKGKDVKRVMDELAAAGAIEKTQHTKLQVTTIEEQASEQSD